MCVCVCVCVKTVELPKNRWRSIYHLLFNISKRGDITDTGDNKRNQLLSIEAHQKIHFFGEHKSFPFFIILRIKNSPSPGACVRACVYVCSFVCVSDFTAYSSYTPAS